MKILIVEDEEALAQGLKFNFEQDGYEVILAGDGAFALNEFKKPENNIDFIIMDLMLPGMSGYEACQAIREIDKQVPILVLSARRLSEDKTMAFDCGTDQYMTKPFALPELLSRVRNLLERRTQIKETPSSGEIKTIPLESFEFDHVKVDFQTYELVVREETHSLTKTELELLQYFIQNEGRVLSRAQILEQVWGSDAAVTTRTIDNFVLRLRKLIEVNPAEPKYILSVRGTGYRFLTRK